MVPGEGHGDHFLEQSGDVKIDEVQLTCLLPRPAGLKDLLHGAEQAVTVSEHNVVEFASLFIGNGSGFKCLEIELDGGDRRL